MKLQQRLSQRVVMTPLLQQAIQLLQLSTLELEQVVRKELEENPLLEEVPVETTDAPEAAATPGTADAPAPVEAPPAGEAAETPSKETSSVDGEKADDLPFDLSSAIFDDHGDERTPVSMEERDELPFENLGRSEPLPVFFQAHDSRGPDGKRVIVRTSPTGPFFMEQDHVIVSLPMKPKTATPTAKQAAPAARSARKTASKTATKTATKTPRKTPRGR